MADEQDIKIAVLSKDMEGLRDQHKSQSELTNTKLDNIMSSQATFSTWMQQNSSIPAKVDELWNNHQKQKGLLYASKVMFGAVGGVVAFLAQWLVSALHK